MKNEIKKPKLSTNSRTLQSLHVGNKILRLGKKIPSFGIKISKAWNTKCPCNVLELVDNFLIDNAVLLERAKSKGLISFCKVSP